MAGTQWPEDPGRYHAMQGIQALLNVGRVWTGGRYWPGAFGADQHVRGQVPREYRGDLAVGRAGEPESGDEPGHAEQCAETCDDRAGRPGHDGRDRFADRIPRPQPCRRAEPAPDHRSASWAAAGPAAPTRTWRELCAAATGSRVATRTVLPSLCRLTSSRITCSAAAWSRLAVGSSHNSRLGSVTIALAMAMRCRSLAGSSLTASCRRSPSPTRAIALVAASTRSCLLIPLYRTASITLSRAERVGSSCGRWNTIPMSLPRRDVRSRSASFAVSAPFSR